MSTSFPDSLDNLSNPSSTDELTGHAQQHSNANDAIEALQTKIGIDGSADVDSIDYKINELETQFDTLSNSSSGITEVLGLEGNNDLTIEGIENPTSVDSFNASVYRTVRYEIQISRGSLYYSTSLLLLNDGTNINVAESNIISNTDLSLATISFSVNSGMVNLIVTPVASSVTARFYRTALKA
jgi:hypothetical protein